MTANRATRALVDIELYDPKGTKVAQRYWDGATFRNAIARSFTFTWTVGSARRTGTWTVKIGIFSPAWANLFTWRDRARTFLVVR